MNYRLLKVNENLQRELSLLLQEHPVSEKALITLTGVLVTPDLKHATVWLSVLNSENPEAVVNLLNRRPYEFYESLSRRLKMKHIPQLEFKLDNSRESVDRIEGLLDSISKDTNHG